MLKGAVDSLDLNDFGRPWPDPKRSELRALTAGKDRDLCLEVAWETREIVQGQDRAPNITGLYGKKLRLRLVEAEHEEQARRVIRESLS